jgi:hypothetical protein
MSTEHTGDPCDRCRGKAFDYRRGDLGDRERARFEEHLEECAACRDYVERLDIVVGAAREVDPVGQTSDPDAMFDEIADRIEDQKGGHGSEGSGELEESDNPSWRRSVAAAAAAAAVVGLVVGAGVTSFWEADRPKETVAERTDVGTGGAESQPDQSERESGESDRRVERETEEVKSNREADGGASEPAGFADLREIGSSEDSEESDRGVPENIRLFASTNADWQLRDGKETIVELDSGRLLVEYRPGREARSMEVRAPDCSVSVVGTVFYVSAERDEPRVGVLAGEVEVQTEAGESIRLHDDRELSSEFAPQALPEDRRRKLGSYLDLEAHRRAVREVGTDRDGREPEEPSGVAVEADEPAGVASRDEPGGAGGTSPKRDGRRSPSSLRRRADEAVIQGKYRRAARKYRRFLERTPSDHPGGGPVRLDLANLYVHRLDQPAEAVPHLRSFVDNWPDDVAAPSARDKLCEITRELQQFESDCR